MNLPTAILCVLIGVSLAELVRQPADPLPLPSARSSA